jgi:DsbC/DsbD-like thiol-disulfide interchange protein
MLGSLLLALALPLAADPAAVALVPAQQRPTRETDGNRLVKVALHADRGAVQAGKSFQLCVELRIEPGWHVYWENAGDAGHPTTVDFTGPDGFEFGPVRFPAPMRHASEGDIVSYIHEERLLMLVEVKAPAKLAPDAKLPFRVDCEWLVCTDYCLPGSGAATLELPVAAGEASKANEKLFAEASAKLPRPWKDVLSGARPVVTREGESTKVAIEVPGATKLEYFPYANRSTTLVERTVTRTAKGARIELRFEQTNGARDVDWRGVLWIQDEKGSHSCLQEEWLPHQS